jgi:hypothetical protein
MLSRNKDEATDVDLEPFDFAAFDALPEEIRQEILRSAIQASAELGCVVGEHTLVASNFLNYFPGIHPKNALN